MFYDAKIKESGGTMLMSPTNFNENVAASFTDQRDYGNSLSAHINSRNVWSATINEFNKTFPDANIPTLDTYRPDLDLSDTEREERQYLAYDYSNYKLAAEYEDLPFSAKEKLIQKKINNYLSNVPPSERNKYNSYDYFFEKYAEKQRASGERAALVNEYAQNTATRVGGALVGTGGAVFTDPVHLATLPISFYYGASRTLALTALKTAAYESVINMAAETVVQTQVVPFKQSAGIDYNWSDATNVIFTTGLVSTAIPLGIFGTVGATKAAYSGVRKIFEKNISKLEPEIKSKVEKTTETKQKKSDREVIKEYTDNIKDLSPDELKKFINSVDPTFAKSTKGKEVFKDLEKQFYNDSDNPFDNTPEGLAEHVKRLELAQKQFIKNEDVVVDESVKPGVFDDRVNIPESETRASVSQTQPVNKAAFLDKYSDTTNIKKMNEIADDEINSLPDFGDELIPLERNIDGDVTVSKTVKEIKDDFKNDTDIINELRDCPGLKI
tara:strand:+ start:2272 stop:3765 length:1494 start_codon:yes stop_codon:yes gene_type:complete